MKKIALTLTLAVALAHCSMVRDDTKEVVTDTTTKLMWQDNADAKIVKKNWEEAKQYCEDLVLGGYSDWRLPAQNELLSIVDYTTAKLAIQEGFKQSVESFTYWYWSSSSVVSRESSAWAVHFGDGSIETYHYKTLTYHVRCARESQ